MFKYIRLVIILLIITSLSIIIYKYRRHIPSPEILVETIHPIPTVILETGFPDKHQIKTAFIPQAPEKKWDQPWQDACEEAALLTLHYYYQSQTPDQAAILTAYQQIFDFETSQDWTHDVNLSQMATISAKLWNYQTKIIDHPSLEQIKEYLSQDIPIIIPANGKTLFKENTHFKNDGPWYHNLVILGYDDNQEQFIVHDVGTQFGAYFHYSYNTLMKSIHDFPPSLKKEDIDSGIPRALILVK